MSFTISYMYRDKQVVTPLAVDHLTPYAAVCYALLQSGSAPDSDQHSWPKTYEGILAAAKELGLTDIRAQPSIETH